MDPVTAQLVSMLSRGVISNGAFAAELPLRISAAKAYIQQQTECLSRRLSQCLRRRVLDCEDLFNKRVRTDTTT